MIVIITATEDMSGGAGEPAKEGQLVLESRNTACRRAAMQESFRACGHAADPRIF